MLSEEEKNVIDLLKNIDKQKCLMLNCPVVKNNIERQLKIIELNRIIRKQSKEIEELTNEVMEKELIIDGMKEDRRIAVEEIQEQYFVSKEESEQKEKKAYIDGTNIADKLCNKKWKDKIKAKIEWLTTNILENDYASSHDQDVAEYQVIILQSLLEKSRYMEERKIIEIYVTEDKEEGTTSFNFKSLEDSAEANYMMKLLTDIFAAIYKGKETEAEED